MINQSVNDFYTRFLFKVYALPQEVGFLLDIAATLFNNLRPDVREFLILEGVQVLQILPTETNHQEKPEASPGQKRINGSRKEDKNNKTSSATSRWKPTPQEIH